VQTVFRVKLDFDHMTTGCSFIEYKAPGAKSYTQRQNLCLFTHHPVIIKYAINFNFLSAYLPFQRYYFNNWWIPTHALFHIQRCISLECWFWS